MHDAAIIVDDVWVGYRRTDVGIFKGRRGEPWWGLREIDFSIDRGEWFGVIGPNGAGKTTLCRPSPVSSNRLEARCSPPAWCRR